MAEPSPLRALRAAAVAGALGLAWGCAAGAPAPRPAPLPAAEVRSFAEILRLEDRREMDRAALERFAASPSAGVRRRTALALGRLRDPAGLPLLQRLLADADTSVAATAAFALGQVGDTAAVAWLAARLEEPALHAAPTVGDEAAYALGKLRSQAAERALTDLLARADGTGPERAAVGAALLATWKHPRPATLDPITRWARSNDAGLRWRAAYALTRRADPRAAPLLRELAGDADARVRAMAVRGLTAPLADSAGVGAASVLPVLRAALRDPDYAVRINAARVLGTHRGPEAVAELTALLASPEPHLALTALESLGRIGPAASDAAARLRALAARSEAPLFLRQTALESLARVAPREAVELAGTLRGEGEWRLRASAARALAVAAGPTDPRVTALAEDPDARVAAAALQAAVDAAGERLQPLQRLLLQQLGASDVMVRSTALGALARLRDPSTLPMLMDAYQRAQADTLNDAALAAVDAILALRGDGLDPANAFFARFGRSPDYLVRLRVRQGFGEVADRRWGSALPIDTGRDTAEYRALVERRVAPAEEPEVAIRTAGGEIRLRLLASEAPLTVESFLQLAERGYFDGQQWPRVVPNFVIQGGDPRGDTSGGPGYTLRDEINRARYGTGTLGMALSGPDTGGSQFFVTHSPQPHLDGTYTVFGRVVAGQELAERLLPGDRIVNIRRIR